MKQSALLDCLNVEMSSSAAKTVYLVLAVRSNEDNRCWPSIESLAESTCLHRATVIRAIKYLEQRGLVVADRSGRNTRYLVVLPEVAQVAQCDVSRSATCRTENLDTSHGATSEVAQRDPNLQEPKRTIERETRARASNEKLPDGVDPGKWALFREQLDHDGKTSAPRVMNALGQLRAISKRGEDCNRVLEAAIARGHRDLADVARQLARENTMPSPTARAGPAHETPRGPVRTPSPNRDVRPPLSAAERQRNLGAHLPEIARSLGISQKHATDAGESA